MSEKLFWDITSLKDFAAETKDVEVCGKYIKIRKLPGEIIFQLDDGDKEKQLYKIIKTGLKEPVIPEDKLKELPVSFLNEVAKAINSFSGTDIAEQEKN